MRPADINRAKRALEHLEDVKCRMHKIWVRFLTPAEKVYFNNVIQDLQDAHLSLFHLIEKGEGIQ